MTAGEEIEEFKNRLPKELLPGNVTGIINEATKFADKIKGAMLKAKEEKNIEATKPRDFDLDDIKNATNFMKDIQNEVEASDRKEIGQIDADDGKKANEFYKFGTIENANDDMEK